MLLLHYLLLLASMGASSLGSNTSFITPHNMLTSPNTTKPGCPSQCGNLTIPYPFGIGSECSISTLFTIECDTSYNPPKAFTTLELRSSPSGQKPDILAITETQIFIRNSRISSRCYSSDGMGNTISSQVLSYDMPNTFTFSSASNKLFVIGCDDNATLAGYTGVLVDGTPYQYSSSGCFALCSSLNEVAPGSCAGLGCCQTSIPSGLSSFTITLDSLRSHKNLTFPTCGYAFLAGNDSFSFDGGADFDGTKVVNRIFNHIPLVLDWVVGDVDRTSLTMPTCNQAKRNLTTYACQSNTKCVDVFGGGYRCECLSGFEGNPYLKPGCKDFDECALGENSPCTMNCVNTPGNYLCLCPSGYHGDGYKFGASCTKIENNTLKNISLVFSLAYYFIAVLGQVLLLPGLWWLYLVIKRKKAAIKRSKHFERNGGLLLQQQMSSVESMVDRMKIFTIKELEQATDNFNMNRILGQGGQGTVYKGMLEEGKIVAIKKSKMMEETQLREFINEVFILSQLNHRNIVKLLGCCLETEVPLLVYEFIPNGSLFQHIHYPNEEFPISWKMRLQIATDSAAALAYLHSSSSIPVFHRDVKSSNILLDDKYRAKLSDFGTSRSVTIDQTHITTRVMGTFGYLDPEYFQSSQFTEKSDVYSFGVVLVELLTGEKAIRSTTDQENRSLTSWFISHMETSSLLDIVDSQVLKQGSKEELFHVAKLAMQCLHLDGRRRPAMKEVVAKMETIISIHLSQTNQHNWSEPKQVLTTTPQSIYNDLPSSSTKDLDNHYSNSAELSLLFNPR